MRFWDSSALVPLIVEESRSKSCRAHRRADPDIAIWTLSRTEIVSTVRRLERQRHLSSEHAATALARFELMIPKLTEVVILEAVRDRAERVFGLHDLTAADALQLAAALTVVRDRPRRRGFVTADARLATAAAAQGFDVIVPRER